jgi:hypothetical protein
MLMLMPAPLLIIEGKEITWKNQPSKKGPITIHKRFCKKKSALFFHGKTNPQGS